MNKLAPLAALGLAVLASASSALAGPGDVQGAVRNGVRSGEVLSLRKIEARVLPTMPHMQYLGPEYDPAAMAYRLKFIQNGHVVFVDVDARSGEVIARSH